MPIVLPKCPDNYQLMKEKCRCKKVTKKKPKKKTKKKTRKKKKTIKEISEECKKKGMIYDSKMKKCRNRKKRKKKEKSKKKTKKKQKKKTIKEIREECNKKGMIYDSTTKKCRNRKKRSKKSKMEKNLMESVMTITKERSYSPTINKEFTRKDITHHKDLFGDCKDHEIKINSECLNWKDKRVEKYLLDNLKSTRKIKGENIISPKQNRANCWFNTFFMCYFISDKARKFSKSFRHAMITGMIYKQNGKKEKIPDNLRLPYWKLNKFITASLVGHKDPSLFMKGEKGNTNILIKDIYNLMKSYDPNTSMRNVGESGNPRVMFRYMITMFKIRLEGRGTFKVKNLQIGPEECRYYLKQIDFVQKNGYKYNNEYGDQRWEEEAAEKFKNEIIKNKPHILCISLNEGQKNDSSEGIGKRLVYKFGNLEYTLDSIGIRDYNRKKHICGLLTINGEDYVYDGGDHTPLVKQKWRNLLNKDQDFKIPNNNSSKLKYNLKKSVLYMVYYRTK